MKYDVLTLGDYQTNTYLCYDETRRECVIIDAGYEPETIAARIRDLKLKPAALLLTHGHFDHVGAVPVLARMLNIPVYVSEKELSLPQSMTAGPLYYTDTYEPDETLSFGGMEFRVLETPGHTPGSVCLLCGDIMFSGDTLFYGSCGRTDFPGGSTEDILASLHRLSLLEEDYTVLPGHGPATRLSFEKRCNPYMR